MELKNRFFPAAVILLAAAALLAGGRFPYIFFYLVLLLFLVPYLWLRLALRKLSGDIEVSSLYSEVGQMLTVLYRVDNSTSGRFPYLKLTSLAGGTFSAPEEEQPVALQVGESALYRREVKCTRRGIYDLKTFQVKTGDPFGIFEITKPLAAGKEIKVYPRLKSYPGIAFSARHHFGNLGVRERQYENLNEIADLREWREGDSIKRIHWKQSARHDGFVVKNFERRADASINIFVDMCFRSYRYDRDHILEDLAVEAAASLIYFGLSEGVLLRVFSEPLPPGSVSGRHLRDYRGIMDRLIALSPTGKGSFAGYVQSRSYYLGPKGSLYLFTPRLGLRDAAVLLQLKQRGLFPVLFHLSFAVPEGEKAVLLDKLKEAGIKVEILHPVEESENADRAL